MTTDRELMQQALDALEKLNKDGWILADFEDEVYASIGALRARLAQPEPKPLAWLEPEWGEQICLEVGFEHTITIDHPKDLCWIPLYTAPPQQPERKLWLWKNFVDGRPEYWAFDNPYPTNLDNGDPQTLGQPCGYAIFKPSRDGSRGRTEEQVLREMESVSARSEREWQGLTENEIKHLWYEACQTNLELTSQLIVHLARNIEAKLKEKNT